MPKRTRTRTPPPSPGRDLDKNARRVWDRIAPELNERMEWTTANYTRVLHYCTAVAKARTLEAKNPRAAKLERRMARLWADRLGLPVDPAGVEGRQSTGEGK